MTPRTVLVVDDEPTIRETVADALALDGHRVVSAATGPEALAVFRAERPDLVVLDLMLPELSGVEVCRILRAESAVPIIMVTARDSELDTVVGLEVGADDYVTKPFRLRELAARVRATFRRLDRAPASGAAATPTATSPASSEPGAPTTAPRGDAGRQSQADGATGIVDLGRIRIDLPGHRLLRDGVPVPLRPRAFQLLAFLAANPGVVFTRDQLLDRVWGTDYPGETRTVDVHVHALREAIEADPAAPTILETVRGVGYVLRPSPRSRGAAASG